MLRRTLDPAAPRAHDLASGPLLLCVLLSALTWIPASLLASALVVVVLPSALLLHVALPIAARRAPTRGSLVAARAAAWTLVALGVGLYAMLAHFLFRGLDDGDGDFAAARIWAVVLIALVALDVWIALLLREGLGGRGDEQASR
jgi:hypothetical protein